jgi:lipoprotein-releasing system permease protein
LNLPFFIARRYLVSKKSNNAINIISWISVIAIAIGTAALVIILSFMNGLTGLVQSLYNSFDPDIEVTYVKGKNFIPSEDKLQQIKNIKGVKYICFSIEDIALLKYGNKQTVATVKGVSGDFFKMTRFDTMIYEGNKVLKTKNTNFAIVGKGIAYQLSANIKDFITPLVLYSPRRGKTGGINLAESYNEEQVTPGSYFSINDEFDYKYVVVDLEVARTLFDYEKEISSLEIGLENVSYSADVTDEMKKLMGADFQVKNRFQQNKALFSTLETEKLWTFVILVFILIVATFNIIGALTMLIIEKKKDIITLANIGADASFIRKIFMTEGVLITFIGALIGLLIGFLFCYGQTQFKWVTFDEGFVTDAYPVDVQLKDFLMILGAVFLIGSIAAWFPVRFFTKENALEKFRTEI